MNEATPGSITVRVGGIAIGDGEALPPVVGERRDYHLSFHEVRTIFIDSGLYDEARWIDVVAAQGHQVSPGTTSWSTPLSGPGWTAMWNANRSQRGPARLYGYFQTELSFFAPDQVSGTVTAVRGNWADLTLDVTE